MIRKCYASIKSNMLEALNSLGKQWNQSSNTQLKSIIKWANIYGQNDKFCYYRQVIFHVGNGTGWQKCYKSIDVSTDWWSKIAAKNGKSTYYKLHFGNWPLWNSLQMFYQQTCCNNLVIIQTNCPLEKNNPLKKPTETSPSYACINDG